MATTAVWPVRTANNAPMIPPKRFDIPPPLTPDCVMPRSRRSSLDRRVLIFLEKIYIRTNYISVLIKYIQPRLHLRGLIGRLVLVELLEHSHILFANSHED